MSVSSRDCPLFTLANGPLMARRLAGIARRDPLLRRTWAPTLGPVGAQVSGHAEVSASDCQYPWLSASSGTQWARDLLTLVSCARIRPRSDQFATSGSSLLVVHANPDHQKVVHPRGSRALILDRLLLLVAVNWA